MRHVRKKKPWLVELRRILASSNIYSAVPNKSVYKGEKPKAIVSYQRRAHLIYFRRIEWRRDYQRAKGYFFLAYLLEDFSPHLISEYFAYNLIRSCRLRRSWSISCGDSFGIQIVTGHFSQPVRHSSQHCCYRCAYQVPCSQVTQAFNIRGDMSTVG